MLQQFHAGQRFRHENGGLQIGAKIRVFTTQGLGQKDLGINDAQYFVKTPFAYRKAGVLGRLNALQIFVQRLIDIQVDDVAFRNHQRGNLAVIQAKHVAHHLVLAVFDNARIRAFFQKRVNFFFRDDLIDRMTNPEQAQQQLCRTGQ